RPFASTPTPSASRLAQPLDVDLKPVEVEGPLSLRYLASVGKIDEALLRELNPSFRQGIVPPGKATVRVPSKAADAVAARASTLKNEDANIAVCSYTVREG